MMHAMSAPCPRSSKKIAPEGVIHSRYLCHPYAGTMLIFSVLFQLNMCPKTNYVCHFSVQNVAPIVQVRMSIVDQGTISIHIHQS